MTKRKATATPRTAAASASRRGKGSRAVEAQPVEIVVSDGLTDQQRLWLEQYFICGLNATEAALIAYDTTDRNTAASIGSENLRKPALRSRINERLDEFHLSANEVLARLAFMARGSMEDFLDPDSGTIDLRKAKAAKQLGLIKKYRTKFTTTTKVTAPVSLADDDDTVAKSTTEETEVLEVELELYDAQAALVHIGKHHSLWGDSGVNVNFNMLSDADLEALAAGKAVRPITIEAAK